MPADSPARAVQSWMHDVGQPVHSRPQDSIPAADFDLRLRLLGEEYAELVAAMVEGDLAAVAQELADLVVVAYGTAATYGLDLDRAVWEVMEANRSKLVDGRQGCPSAGFCSA